jgi:hypothetical protein
MAQIQLTKSEIEAMEKKLKAEGANLPEDEATMLEAILRKAKGAMRSTEVDPSWVFNIWTYHF